MLSRQMGVSCVMLMYSAHVLALFVDTGVLERCEHEADNYRRVLDHKMCTANRFELYSDIFLEGGKPV